MFENNFLYRLDTFWICLTFFLTILLMGYLGKTIGYKFYFRKYQENEINLKSFRTVEAGLFGLFGFMMGFTFNFTATRYDNTKKIIIEEANAIGTAILMANLYKPHDRDTFRKEFKVYLETAIKYYSSGIENEKPESLRKILFQSSTQLWNHVSILSHEKDYTMANRNMIPALKDMFNTAYTRQAVMRSRMPDMILIMLYIISAIAVFLAGFTSKHIRFKEKFTIVIFAISSTLILYIILDYDRPLRGLITDRIGEETMIEKRKLLE